MRSEVLPAIPEAEFSHLYAQKKGRPGIPVSVFVVLSFLKEFFKLTDSQLLEAFHFNLTFLHALGLAPGELTMAERSLYYLRERIAPDPAVAKTFEVISEVFRQQAGIVCDLQRLDSTHICSNMANLNRLQLFVRTIESFLGKLRKALPERLACVPEALRERYLDRSGYFGDTTGENSQRRLAVAAKDLAALIDLFQQDAEVKAMKSFGLLVRLFEEQCQRVPASEQPTPVAAAAEAAAATAPEPIRAGRSAEAATAAVGPSSPAEQAPASVSIQEGADAPTAKAEMVAIPKPAEEVSSSSLQNPSDPDASYNRHKGKGYEAQLAETCHPDNPFQLITYVDVHGAHIGDQNTTLPFIEATQARQCGPKTLLADTNYNSAKNLLGAAVLGVDLLAPTPGKADPDDFSLLDFHFDWDTFRVGQCPEGQTPARQNDTKDGQGANIHFDRGACQACPSRDSCPAGKNNGHLRITLEALAIACSRARESTPEFKKAYRRRSGMEATNHELKTGHGLGRLWTRGLARVTFAVFMKALACNVKRYARYRSERSGAAGATTAGALTRLLGGTASALCHRLARLAAPALRLWRRRIGTTSTPPPAVLPQGA
ncbi:MAG: transposase [Deferrisomatales bacterium]